MNGPICYSGLQESPFRMKMPMAIYKIPILMLGLDPPQHLKTEQSTPLLSEGINDKSAKK